MLLTRLSPWRAAKSGRWQAPAAVLPPEGWQRGRGPEGPEDKGHGHSRARRAREWPKQASPRARGRAKPSARLGACQCYYMFFTTQLKIAKFMGRSQDLNVGQKSWKLQWSFVSAIWISCKKIRLNHASHQKLCDVKNSQKWGVCVKNAPISRPVSLSLPRLFLAQSHPCLKGNNSSSIIDRNLFYTAINR